MATILRTGALIPPQQPRLLAAPVEYSSDYMEQYSNALRLYFNQLQTFFQLISTDTGGSVIKFPYGAFSSNVTQTATVNTATLMTLNSTDFSNGVSINSSKIAVTNAGLYNFQFSVQLESTDVAPQDVFIWLRQGNDGGGSADITGSTGVVGMPARKTPTDPFHDIYGWNYFINMAANDYIQVYWSTTSANVSIKYYPASGSPTKPSTASVVATLSFVSAPLS